MKLENKEIFFSIIITLIYILIAFITRFQNKYTELLVLGMMFGFGFSNSLAFFLGTPMYTGKGVFRAERNKYSRIFVFVISLILLITALAYLFIK